jgi:hypothetical protein
MGLAALLALIAACFNVGSDKWINMLLLIFGGLLGWVTGILATPLDSDEKSQFSTYAAAISTFLSGFLVAKLDKLFDMATEGGTLTSQSIGSALIFGSSVVLGALFTFVGRKYLPEGGKPTE